MDTITDDNKGSTYLLYEQACGQLSAGVITTGIIVTLTTVTQVFSCVLKVFH